MKATNSTNFGCVTWHERSCELLSGWRKPFSAQHVANCDTELLPEALPVNSRMRILHPNQSIWAMRK
jgi:hypothetical protein